MSTDEYDLLSSNYFRLLYLPELFQPMALDLCIIPRTCSRAYGDYVSGV